MSEELSVVYRSFFDLILKTAIYVSIRMLLVKRFFSEKKNCLSILDFLRPRAKFLQRDCQKCIVCVHMNVLMKIVSIWEESFFQFGIFSSPGREWTCRFVKIACYVSMRKFEVKFFLKEYCFSNNVGRWAKDFRHLSKYFWRGCQNCILRLLRNILMETFCSVKNTQYLLINEWTLL